MAEHKLGIDEPKEWPDDIVMRERRLRYMVMFLAILVCMASVVTIVSYRQTRVARAELLNISKSNQNLLASVQSCTQPGGECYEAGVRTRTLLEQESKQVIEHRDRNEELHDVICRRQDEMAMKSGYKLEVKCPPRLSPHTDSE